jgi:hypothetical protein
MNGLEMNGYGHHAPELRNFDDRLQVVKTPLSISCSMFELLLMLIQTNAALASTHCLVPRMLSRSAELG